MKGLFITMEGPDGAGKTTVINQLIPLLQKHALVDIVSTREPGGSRIAERYSKSHSGCEQYRNGRENRSDFICCGSSPAFKRIRILPNLRKREILFFVIVCR